MQYFNCCITWAGKNYYLYDTCFLQLINDTVGSWIIGPPQFFPLDPTANKLCNIEHIECCNCCGNKMRQIVANMLLSQYLRLQLNLLWKTAIWKAAISGYLLCFLDMGRKNYQEERKPLRNYVWQKNNNFDHNVCNMRNKWLQTNSEIECSVNLCIEIDG